jgi:predicted  nucleic acid-binding Zn-ribbon protein
MPTKLKNLRITSTDLVDAGANPDAHIRLFKRAETARNDVMEGLNNMDVTANETANETAKNDSIAKRDDALQEKGTINKMETVQKADTAEMATEKEQAASLHPEVKKALADMEELRKAQAAEIAELKKSLEMERLTGIAKKYEPIGKKAAELAPKLYEMKKAGGTAYDDYVALLDEHLNTVEKSGLFAEIGSNASRSGGVGKQIDSLATDITKTNTHMNRSQAIIKAFEDNTEIAAQYEKEYQGGVY